MKDITYLLRVAWHPKIISKSITTNEKHHIPTESRMASQNDQQAASYPMKDITYSLRVK